MLRYNNAKLFAQIIVPKVCGRGGSRVAILYSQSSLIDHLPLFMFASNENIYWTRTDPA